MAFSASPYGALMRVCLLGALHYENDNRTMRYAQALRSRGDDVDVICVGAPGQPRHEIVGGIGVFRAQTRVRNERNVTDHIMRLVRFLYKAGLLLSRLNREKRYDLIHAHSIPDFVVLSAFLPRLAGAKVILDIYDLTPELYLSKAGKTRRSIGYRLALLIERASCQFADHVISANHLWHERLTQRSVRPQRCTAFVNYVDQAVFFRRERLRNDGRLIIVYPGTLNFHQGLDIALQAFAEVRRKYPSAQFHIYGGGPELPRLKRLAGQLGLDSSAFFFDTVPLERVPQIMADADLGIVSKRNDVFGDEAYSTKIAEYFSQGLPAVVSRTRIDSYYFTDKEVAFFEPQNVGDLARQMIKVLGDEALRRSMAEAGLAWLAQNAWAVRKSEYLALVDRLVGTGPSVSGRQAEAEREPSAIACGSIEAAGQSGFS